MTLDELKDQLRKMVARSKETGFDQEVEHGRADDLLLMCIGNAEVEALFDAIPKWYA